MYTLLVLQTLRVISLHLQCLCWWTRLQAYPVEDWLRKKKYQLTCYKRARGDQLGLQPVREQHHHMSGTNIVCQNLYSHRHLRGVYEQKVIHLTSELWLQNRHSSIEIECRKFTDIATGWQERRPFTEYTQSIKNVIERRSTSARNVGTRKIQ